MPSPPTMGPTTLPRRGGVGTSPAAAPIVAAVVALVAYAALHLTGTGMISDSWAYWQGAISLAGGHGYTYFWGTGIEAWPPLYSIYLALWVALAGPQGWVLTTATGLLVVLQAALWMRLVRTLADDSGIAAPRPAWLLVAAFTGLFLALHQRAPFSHALLYVVLPVLLENVWRIIVRGDARRLPVVLGLAVLVPLIHTSGLAFVGASALLLAARQPRTWQNMVGAGLVLALPVVAWIVMRQVLGQGGSHCIGFGAGRFGPLAYAVQLVDGPGRLLVPDRWGAPILAVTLLGLAAIALASTGPGKRALRFALAVCALVLGALYVLFNLAWVYVPIGGRFVLFAPVLLVSLVALGAASRRPALGPGLMVLLLVPQLYWFAIWVADQRTADALFARQPTAFLPHEAHASRDHREGPPLRRDGRLLVAPDPEAQTNGDCH